MSVIKLALAKGRLAEETLKLLERAGISCPEMKEKSRKLVFRDQSGMYEFIMVKPSDVPTYVDYGVADVGVAGKDTLLEENRPLYERLWENGCILSEYPPGTLPHSRLFPPRNRIISALSDLVLVIEAREKSGTLITVDMALEQGKDVFAVPGRITDTCSRGCNRLIGNGAGIAVSVAQLLQELQGSVPHAGRDEAFSLAQAERPNAAKAAGVIADKMLCPVTDALSSTASSSWPPLRKTIWQALDTMPQSMDEIADTLVRQKISINVQMLMQELVFLELEGAAGSVMGRYYRKTFACNDG